ncbi:ribose 5-phosphate isomerase B [Pendulispora brunnea]|uniref:Ribose 5-phosphate isomerase B n=1 Tax=Pendulispora brunnea TaxID=2905690 RepID=A0ABZ2KJE9_9BACT
MKIAIAGDHAGFELKEALAKVLTDAGHEVKNLGTNDGSKPSDYPDFAVAMGEALSRGDVERGVLVCGSGVGISVAVNKFPGVRAGLCHDTYSAHQGVEHDDMNVLCIGARIIGTALATELVLAFVAAKYTNEERHVRRLAKVKAIEERFLRR